MTLLKFIKFIYLLIMVLTYYVAFIWCLKKFCLLIYNSDKSHFRVSIGTDKYLQNPLFFFSVSLCSPVTYISTCSRGW